MARAQLLVLGMVVAGVVLTLAAPPLPAPESSGTIIRAPVSPVVITTWDYQDAVARAWKVLDAEGRSALDAVEEGCSLCEALQCRGTVGFGGSPDEAGETTLDAMIMDGVTMNVGAVAALRRVRSAISVARRVMDRTAHTLLAGSQATKFALLMGFPEQTLTTNHSQSMWQDWLLNNCQPNFWKSGMTPNPRKQCGPYRPLVSDIKLVVAEAKPPAEPTPKPTPKPVEATTLEPRPTEAVSAEAKMAEAVSEVKTTEVPAAVEPKPTDAASEAKPTEATTVAATEAVSEAKPTESASVPSTEAVTEAKPTEAVSEARTTEATVDIERNDIPTEHPSEAKPTEAVSEAKPTEPVSEAQTTEAALEARTKATETVSEAKPTETVPEAKPTEAVSEAKPTEAAFEAQTTEAAPEAKATEAEAKATEAVAEAQPTTVSPDAKPTEMAETTTAEAVAATTADAEGAKTGGGARRRRALWQPLEPRAVVDPWNHDTIGMVAMDAEGRLAAGTSTNGARHKIAGRVGDSPIPGSGAFADQEVGAAAATGDGDIMMRFVPSFLAVELMRQGKSPEEAAQESIRRIGARYPDFSGALIVLRKDGEYAAACHNLPVRVFPNGFPLTVRSADVSQVTIKYYPCQGRRMHDKDLLEGDW